MLAAELAAQPTSRLHERECVDLLAKLVALGKLNVRRMWQGKVAAVPAG